MDAVFLTIDPFISFKKDGRFAHDLRMRLQSINNQFPEATNNNSDARSLFAEYQFWYKIANVLSVNAGVLQNYSLIESQFYGDHDGLNLAGYTQLNVNPTNRLKFVGGFRLEQNSLDGVPNRLVPLFRAGANYGVFDYTFLRASFGQGYRYPSIAEKHASTTLGAVKIVPNPFVEPEKGWNGELGVKQGLAKNNITGMIDLALFYSQSTDLIEYVFGIYPDPITNDFSYGFRATNVEYSRVYGFEVEFMLNHSMGGFRNTYSGGYVYMYPVEFNPSTGLNSDVYLKFRRKHSGKINLNSRYNKYDFGLSFYAKSKILSIDNVFLDPLTREDILPGFYDYWTKKNSGYFLVDASVGYTFTANYFISFVIKNLTNTEYMGRPGDIMPHRNFSFRITGRF
jgi:iron complex outermembrane receptor protein